MYLFEQYGIDIGYVVIGLAGVVLLLLIMIIVMMVGEGTDRNGAPEHVR